MLSLWRVRCAAMQRRQCKGTPRSTHRCARRMGARVRCVSWHKSWGWTSRKARTLPSRWVEPSKTRSICPLLLLRIWCLHTRCCWGIRRVQGGNGTSVCVCVCLSLCVCVCVSCCLAYSCSTWRPCSLLLLAGDSSSPRTHRVLSFPTFSGRPLHSSCVRLGC